MDRSRQCIHFLIDHKLILSLLVLISIEDTELLQGSTIDRKIIFANKIITIVAIYQNHFLSLPIRILLNAREDIKYSPRAIILLIGMQIVDMKLLDEHLAKVSQNCPTT